MVVMDRMLGQTVVMTGAGGGIGRACALECAREGAEVVVVDIHDSLANRVVSEVKSEGNAAVAVTCDVTSAADVRRMMERSIDEFGKINALFNAAGIDISDRDGNVETCSEDTWARTIAVNLTGTYLCSKFAVPHIREAGGGAILNVGSIACLWGENDGVAYTASKGGVLALTRAMAFDHGKDNIRVNCLCPGWHVTPMTEPYLKGDSSLVAELGAMSPLGRVGRPEELAKTVVHLLSNEDTFMTSAVIVVDGGVTAGHRYVMGD